MTHTEAIQQLGPYVAAGRLETFQGAILIVLAAVHGHIDVPAFATRLKRDFRHYGRADTGVRELAIDDDANLLAQRLLHAIPMVFSCAMFWHGAALPLTFQAIRSGCSNKYLQRRPLCIRKFLTLRIERRTGKRVTATDDEFRNLVNEHSSMAFSVALRLVGDRGLAEEVAQDVFLELHHWLPRLESPDHVRHWVRRVATHRSMDALRRRKVRPEGQSEQWDDIYDRPASEVGDGAMGVAVEKMLLSLPEQQRTVLVLRYGEDLSPEEIARTLGDPVATVKSNLQRGLQLLRRKGSVVLKEFVRG